MYDADVILINDSFLIAFFSGFFYLVWVFIFCVDDFVIQTTSMDKIYNSALLESSILFRVICVICSEVNDG